MIERRRYLEQLAVATRRAPVTALLGPRQCGKTTLARSFPAGRAAAYLDLESQADLRRFWTMLAHYHGQIWNASELARSMGLSDKTVRGYLDLLTGTFMVRQLQPWYENLAKRQIKSPKVYFRDSGLLHRFLELADRRALLAHPRVGASFEGFVIEQLLQVFGTPGAFFWAAHGGAELDLLLVRGTHRYGIEIKLSEAPAPTRSLHTAIEDLRLDHVWMVYPGAHVIPMDDKITGWPVHDIAALADQVVQPARRAGRSGPKRAG